MNQAPDIQLLQELFKAAKQNLTPEIWDYLIGGAESETTLKRNRQALERLAFRPRVLRDVWEIDCGKDLLGIRQRIPVFTAPIGSLQDLHPEGAAAVARASGKFGVLSMHSIVTKPSLEEIAAAERIILCYAWDGNTLPIDHGFPLRIWRPDRYGMKQPKWITGMEIMEQYKEGYWIERGWDEIARVNAVAVVDLVATDGIIMDGEQRRVPV